MRYLGGKFRVGKEIAQFLNSIRGEGQGYWEPFVGSAWVLSRIQGEPRYASDANYCLIEMWKALQDGWVPPTEISELEYSNIRASPDNYPPELVSFVAFGCSFAGKWFGGYARSGKRNYAKNAHNSLMGKIGNVQSTIFFCADFMDCDVPNNNLLIYCDPPYQHATGYGAIPNWDSAAFWEKARELSALGHTIVVSEYQAPPDFKEVMSFRTKTDMHTQNGKETRTERLFMPKPRTVATMEQLSLPWCS